MKKLNLYLTVLITVLCFSCSDENSQISGSGTIISEERTLDAFTKIIASSSLNINIVYGQNQNISISADDNIIDRINTIVNNSTLTIDLSSGNYSNITAQITITIPAISQIQNSGSGNITFSNFLELNNIAFINSGSGSIQTNGEVKNLNINVSGSGSFNGFGLVAQDCIINNSGSGSSELNCTVSLSGTNSGSGAIYYKGEANVTVNNTGSGSVINSN